MTETEPFAMVPHALTSSGLSDRAVRVYACLAQYANKDRRAWPRQSAVVRRLGCSLPTVQRAVRELRDAGWISTALRESGGVLEYTLHMAPIQVSEPCEPPITVDGTPPSPVMGHITRTNELDPQEENTSCSPLPPRAAVRREADLARRRDDALDPAKALNLWDCPAPAAPPSPSPVSTPRRSPAADAPMGLALAWRRRMQEARVAGALDSNVKALARAFRVMLAEGVTPEQIRSMTGLYATATGMRNPAVAPWRHFLYQRHLLLSRIREAENFERKRNDPDAFVYTLPTAEQLEAQERRHAQELADYLANCA